VPATGNKLTKLVEDHPQLHPKVEGVLVDVCNKLEPEDSAANRKQKRMKIHAQSTVFQMMNSSRYLDMLVKDSMALLHARLIGFIKSILRHSEMEQ